MGGGQGDREYHARSLGQRRLKQQTVLDSQISFVGHQ
jgi:hypothetical protein